MGEEQERRLSGKQASGLLRGGEQAARGRAERGGGRWVRLGLDVLGRAGSLQRLNPAGWHGFCAGLHLEGVRGESSASSHNVHPLAPGLGVWPGLGV